MPKPLPTLSFSPLLLDAVRAGRKTVTRRRLAAATGVNAAPDNYFCGPLRAGWAGFMTRNDRAAAPLLVCNPFGLPGELLAVLEDRAVVLEIVSVAAEQVRSITVADALAEGISAEPGAAIAAFARLIELFYPGCWQRNEWVWVVTFRRHHPAEGEGNRGRE